MEKMTLKKRKKLPFMTQPVNDQVSPKEKPEGDIYWRVLDKSPLRSSGDSDSDVLTAQKLPLDSWKPWFIKYKKLNHAMSQLIPPDGYIDA